MHAKLDAAELAFWQKAAKFVHKPQKQDCHWTVGLVTLIRGDLLTASIKSWSCYERVKVGV